MMSLFQSHCRPPISRSVILPPNAGTQTMRLVPPRISTNPNSPAVGKWRVGGRVTNGSFTCRRYPGSLGRSASSETPRVAKMRATASPILLFGVLAPAVTPTLTVPVAGSQFTAVSS